MDKCHIEHIGESSSQGKQQDVHNTVNNIDAQEDPTKEIWKIDKPIVSESQQSPDKVIANEET